VHVLNNMIEAVRPGGIVLDLQVIRPKPRIEAEDRLICEIDGEPLFRRATAAASAIDTLIDKGRLAEQAVDDHDVLSHYDDGPDLVDDFAGKERRLPSEAMPRLLTLAQPCVIRERCRLRRLGVS
jgi:hypothetical protein